VGVDAVSAGIPAVFLDRDGVLNRMVVRQARLSPPASLAELEIPPDAPAALGALRTAGFLLVCVTNQPDVARGTQTRDVVEAINAALLAALPLRDIRVCYHDDPELCPCRKPRPGLLLDAAAEHRIDLRASFMIGDRWKDVEAGDGRDVARFYWPRTMASPTAIDPLIARSVPSGSRSVDPQPDATRRASAMRSPSELGIKLFADGADTAGMLALYRNPLIKGFTTNPTLMRKAGVTDYEAFALEILEAIPDRPISFEVFADEFAEMARQAHKIAGWGANLYVKIPVTNTRGISSAALIRELAQEGIKLNVTAILTLPQVREVSEALAGGPPAIVSVFAGRIADTGRDPVPLMAAALELACPYPNIELLWASPRELLNLVQADAMGCHIITATPDILQKLSLVGKPLDEYSLDTVKMFRDDAFKAAYRL
jgi:transaldolase